MVFGGVVGLPEGGYLVWNQAPTQSGPSPERDDWKWEVQEGIQRGSVEGSGEHLPVSLKTSDLVSVVLEESTE